jgi:hypothetical protein
MAAIEKINAYILTVQDKKQHVVRKAHEQSRKLLNLPKKAYKKSLKREKSTFDPFEP